ncbi:UNVERIFIED_CONTAM: hypothetical protein FKN15_018892 [Acipenser sinensis]
MSVTEAGGTASQDGKAYPLQIYPRLAAESSPCCTLTVPKSATAAAVIQDVAVQLELDPSKCYVLAEVKECGGEEWVLEASDLPVQRVLLWPRRAHQEHPQSEGYYFLLQERNADGSIRYVHLPVVCQEKEARRLTARGFLPPKQADFDDLCNLPHLTEEAILDNLKNRFHKHNIYTYAGSILLAINPFKFLPIYNPKYVKMYDNHQLGKLEPHIFAIADVAYHAMLRKHVNQCIVISGESGSGKTQSTNFLIHCLTALSQKGYASGVERTILGAGPVLEVRTRLAADCVQSYCNFFCAALIGSLCVCREYKKKERERWDNSHDSLQESDKLVQQITVQYCCSGTNPSITVCPVLNSEDVVHTVQVWLCQFGIPHLSVSCFSDNLLLDLRVLLADRALISVAGR